ncbi:MAG TPA: hypothetical protein VNZ86_00135, partial [Bacteroidia bacterium]|nr:hypothetical protein [Bacteroidia bacterium]
KRRADRRETSGTKREDRKLVQVLQESMKRLAEIKTSSRRFILFVHGAAEFREASFPATPPYGHAFHFLPCFG